MPENTSTPTNSKPIKKHNPIIITFLGIIIALCGFIGFLSASSAVVSSPFIFITYIFAYPILFLFGFVGYWIFYPALVFIGFLIFFRSRLTKVKFSLKIVGAIAIFVGLLTLFSELINNAGPEGLLFGNCWDNYITIFNECGGAAANSTGFMLAYNLSGGILGYFIAGSFNSVSPIMTWVIVGVLMLTGIILIFLMQILKMFTAIENKNKKAKEESQIFENIKNIDSVGETLSQTVEEKTILQRESDSAQPNQNSTATVHVQSAPTPIIPAPAPTPIPPENSPDLETYNLQMKSFNKSQGFVRAHFYREGDIPKDDLSEPTISKQKLNVDDDLNAPNSNLAKAKKSDIKPIAFARTEFGNPDEQSVGSKPAPVIKSTANRKFIFPSLDLLKDYNATKNEATNIEACQERIKVIDETYLNLGIGAHVTGFTLGPSVTRFDVQPDADVPVGNLMRYVQDISRALKGVSVRFEPVVMGKTTAGLEIPNATTAIVGFKDALKCMGPKDNGRTIIFGKDISGEFIKGNIEQFPHMLIAGTTGSGKSIFMHSIIMSLIMRNRPDEIKLLLIDPKKVEMTLYENEPHLLRPIVTDATEAKNALEKLVKEMDVRYSKFQDSHCQNIKQYNEYAKENDLPIMPYIVIIFDEYADISENCKEIQRPVVMIAQKARAAGIHMIISTQRPSVDIINGVIKSNLPTKVALAVSSDTDSLVILDRKGAETLLGYGDMLVSCTSVARNTFLRLQGCFVDNKEIFSVVNFLKKEWPADYDEDYLDLASGGADGSGESSGESSNGDESISDDLFDLVRESVMTREYASISSIQREFSVGYNRAGRLFIMLKNAGIVAAKPETASSAKGCKVLVHADGYGKTSENPGSSDLVKTETVSGDVK
ncbi:MAG: DNA translocase FtsK [Bacilli bacterium]|jgi:DNA segregation ATPase FtsK/SpoIIIE-like protein